MKIEILWQSADLIAVNKPEGVSIHNAEDAQNLISLLSLQIKDKKFFPVHRLDKETSGVQLFALNEKAAATYAKAFQERAVKKIYYGVLRGSLKDGEGVWNSSLTDKAEGRMKPDGATTNRISCETKYRVLESNKYMTLCEFDLLTGRQHQIRKHSALARHHLVGDNRYGDPKYNQKMASIYGTPRMFLHCGLIQIDSITIEAKLPDIFQSIFKSS